MIKEHDRVILTEAIEEHGLEPGDIGAVVYVHGEGDAARGQSLAHAFLDQPE